MVLLSMFILLLRRKTLAVSSVIIIKQALQGMDANGTIEI